MHVQPYLLFNGRCEEALEFYGRAIGAEVEMLLRYRESPEPGDPKQIPANWDDKVIHSEFRVGDSVLMASDGNSASPAKFDGIMLNLTVSSPAEADRVFGALSEGGKVTMPLTATFYSPRFGMLVDRFGVTWMVYVAP